MDPLTIGTTLSAITKIVSDVRNSDEYKQGKKTVGQAALVYKHYKDASLSDLSKLTRVEPLAIVSKDLVSFEPMVDVQQAVLSIFTAHYLQAVNIVSNVQSVELIKALDRLNPARDKTGFLLSQSLESHESSFLTQEAYRYSLPRDGVDLAFEDKKEGAAQLDDIVNLSVGRMINVKFGYTTKPTDEKPRGEDHSCTIPINIRLMASTIPNRAIIGVLAHQTEDTGLVERYHAWRSGRISFIKDLIFAQDLIDEHKRASISDDSRTLQTIASRVAAHKTFGLLTQNPSLATASNIFVISEEVARELESKLGGKLSNAATRNKAFENTYAMLIVVVDREWNRVTFYTRGCAEATDLSLKEIKNKSGSKGPDLMDMMKAMNMGMNASF